MPPGNSSTGDAHPGDAGPGAPTPSESSSELRFLDPSSIHFGREGARLRLRMDGETDGRDVAVARLFPLSEPERWVSVLDKDGKEIGVIEDLHKLSREDLAHVREELHRRYLVPKIRRILSCRVRFDLAEWTVETDRGRMRFLTRNLRDQVKDHVHSHLAMTDMEGNRYDIPSIEALDPDSRRRLEEQL